MSYAVVAAMVRLWCEMTQTNIIVNFKAKPQSDRVMRAAYEAVIGVDSYFIHQSMRKVSKVRP